MPITIKSTFKKQEFLYESPDGDRWSISYVESEDRKYIEIGKDGDQNTTVWDVPMLLDIADQIRMMSPKARNISPRLPSPTVKDHRNDNIGGPPSVSEQIEDSASKTMENFDDSVVAIESLSSKSSDAPKKIKKVNADDLL